MAVTREFLDVWVAAHGPWAYHICDTVSVAAKVLGEGLRPVGNGVRSRSVDELAARPGHVYLCVGKGVGVVADQSFGRCARDPALLAAQTVAVDLRALNPSSISPDEDCCYESTLTFDCGADAIMMPGARDCGLTVRDAYGDTAERDDPAAFAARPYASYGEWAEGENVGADPAHTAACWQTFGSLAHRGAIAPGALRPTTVDDTTALVSHIAA